jgi:hypothetical protein
MLLRCVFLGAVLVMSCLGGAQAQWSFTQRDQFMNDCVPGCQNNPNVHPSRRGECRAFCECFVREAEVVGPDYAALERELGGAIETERVRRFKAIGPVCNQRVFGN